MTTSDRTPLGIYLHIPFCLSKCRYCGFYSMGGVDTAQQQAYVRQLLADIDAAGARYGAAYAVDTVFVGGGTPSILPGETMAAILDRVRGAFCVEPDAEITVEANPKTLTVEKLRAYRRAGVDRLSVGLQSLDDGVLQTLGRVHTAADFLDTWRLIARQGFTNVNVDLMFAVPGHTMACWHDTLARVLTLEPAHLSFYSLQFEEGTPFYEMLRRGQLTEVPDEVDREMYHSAIAALRAAGYVHYEISNAARPGFACRHNLKYWSMEDYLGIGSAASSFVGGVRFTNPPRAESHVNDLADTAGEFVFTGLRKTCGIRFADFAARTGHGFWEVFGDRRGELLPYLEAGLLLEDADGLRLSEAGIDVSNAIMAIFV